MSFENYRTRLDYELSSRKISSTWLAAQIGLSSRTIENYRSGMTSPRADEALKIANIFGLTVEELIQKFEPTPAKAA